MIYLAIPYTDSDPNIRHDHYEWANQIAAKLMASGVHVFSPISHCHPLIEIVELPSTWEYWEQYDRKFLAICDTLVVVRIPGWEKSIGVRNEIKIAKEMGIKIRYLDPELFL